jgi:FtsP/CotA-like multicopper oxidase with cupredoxin domain
MALLTKQVSKDSNRFEFTRRRFIQGTALTLAGVSLPLTSALAGARSYSLSPAPAKAQLLGKAGSPKTDVWAFSGNVPGPVIRARQGERLKIVLGNGLPQETTLHCHGLRLPNAMDGVPDLTQAAIKPGEKFTYEFDLPDAGTYWYHPHIYTTQQVGRGLNGAMIVEEKHPPKVDRELLWVVDDWRVGDDGALSDDFDHPHDISHGGRIGNLVTINGEELDNLPVKAGERLRLRMINAANARVFGLRFEGMEPTVIALDGHPVTPHAPPDGRVVFGPGQRVELILDVAGNPGDRLAVVDDYYDRFKYTLITFDVDPGEPLRESPMDASITLPANPLAEPDLAQAETQEILIEGGAMGGLREAVYKGEKVSLRKLWRQHRKVWVMNGVASSGFTEDPMFRLKHGKSYRWRIRNDTVWDHPMHLHGHAFRIVTRNDKPVPHTPWSDTVMLHADDTVEIAFMADNPGKWLFHCHVLEHHLGGMGGVIEVA